MAMQVEIVNPDLTWSEWFGVLFGQAFILAIRVLVIWCAISSWIPELGLTYWQLILPVVAFRELILPTPFRRTAK